VRPPSPEGGLLVTALAFRRLSIQSEFPKMVNRELKDDVVVMKIIKDMQHRSFSFGEGDGG